MTHQAKVKNFLIIDLLPRLAMMIMLLLSQFNPVMVHSARADLGQNIGDFISLGANTVRELQKAIDQAGGTTRQTLQQLKDNIEELTQSLSNTYQNNLGITIDSLDTATKNKLMDLQRWINEVNETLQADIHIASTEAQNVIISANNNIQLASHQLEQSLKNVIVVGGETTAYVVDRAIYDGILIVSLVFLGIGLLCFVWLLFTRRIPQGLGGALVLIFILIYLAGFGAIAFVPTARGDVMAYTGIGLEKRLQIFPDEAHIIDVFPRTVNLGKDLEFEIWGTNLVQKNKSLTVTIFDKPLDKPVRVSAASDQLVVVNVATLSAPDGSAPIILNYDGVEGARGVVKFTHPAPPPSYPDLVITNFILDPPSPVLGQNVHATITVYNQGSGPSGNFQLGWKPYASFVPIREIPANGGLSPGFSKTFGDDFALFPNAGTFDSIAIADSDNEVTETREDNNMMQRQITITKPPEPPKETKWTSINFEANRWGCGVLEPCDQRFDYTADIPIETGWHWDGDSNSVKNSLTYSTSGWGVRSYPPSVYVIGDPVLENGKVKVIIHVGAAGDITNRNPHIYINIGANEVKN
jgi:hypothetical protein